MGHPMHASSYRIKVRNREHHETTVHKASGTHRRRVARWGKWKLHSAGRTPQEAADQLDAVKRLNPTSDVAVFFEGKRLTVEQLRYRVNQDSADEA